MAEGVSQLNVTHAFGYDPNTRVLYADSTVLVAACGNGLSFASVKRDSRSVFLWGSGTCISTFDVNRAARLVAYAEKRVSPSIFVHDLFTFEPVRSNAPLCALSILPHALQLLSARKSSEAVFCCC